MFKHLLIPSDGSATAERAVVEALQLAKEGGARLTALHVVQPFHVFSYEVGMLEDTRASYDRHARERGQFVLESIRRAGREMDVAVDTVLLVAEHPYEKIIDTATERGCDLIVMASHGRRGLQAMLLGSETQKVLTHSTIPVLVFR
ncbi:MAG TPA: universal stress protein [Rubrivivax sp.]|nr:universal stress protein [Rubrivivax sp.]